ncbi:MAG TPA: PP2C family protein-serine/threonine phosphatase [Terracidiphilus sp.]|nr:PP2C family protein-serine/threonine phosphatase [Terracidiphilus sp.]
MTVSDTVVDVSQDWALACHVQQRFMHGLGRNTGSVDYSGYCCQVRALGGDCCDFLPLTEDQLTLVVGDASGKGVAAALMMASIQASLRTAALFTGENLAALHKIVNMQAYASSLAERYATVFYGVFDKPTRVLRYVNAGHNAPIVLRSDGSVDCLEPGGAPIGMFPDSNYRESRLSLHSGDLVIAYTDGVVEATNPEGEEWGVQGLLQAANAWKAQCGESADSDHLVRFLFDSMDSFSEGSQTDDATVAVLRIL